MKFFVWFVAALVVVAVVSAYSAFSWVWDRDEGQRVMRERVVSIDREKIERIRPKGPRPGNESATSSGLAPKRPRPKSLTTDDRGAEGSRRKKGRIIAHPRAGLGYSSKAERAQSGPGPSLRGIRDTLPVGGASPRTEALVPARPEGSEGGLGGDDRPKERILGVEGGPPFVEVMDHEGAIHRLELDNNGHLFYVPPGGEPFAVDALGQASAFNLAVDLSRNVHVAWHEAGTNQLQYAWLAYGGKLPVEVFASRVLAKAEPPAAIRMGLSETAVRIEYGDVDSLAYVIVPVGVSGQLVTGHN